MKSKVKPVKLVWVNVMRHLEALNKNSKGKIELYKEMWDTLKLYGIAEEKRITKSFKEREKKYIKGGKTNGRA